MNEIEKMYKNAGIPKYGKRQCKDSEYLECQNYCFCNMDNKCDKFIIEYPPFTAEKQLELIKWLADTDYYIHSIYRTIDTRKHCIENSWYDIEAVGFEEALAGLINKLWKDMSEEEKQQIKEILEDE